MALEFEVSMAVALWVEVLIYGVYSCLFFEALYLLWWKHKPSKAGSSSSCGIYLLVISLMYILISVHIAIGLYRLLQAFVLNVDPAGSGHYLVDFSRHTNVLNVVLLSVVTWIADILVIYRCYIIWNRSYVVIIAPVLLLLVALGINIFVIHWFIHPDLMPHARASEYLNWIYPLAFAQNVLTTGLIIYKLWSHDRIAKRSGLMILHSSASPVSAVNIMRVVIESALIYTLQIFVLIILNATNSQFQWIIQSAILPSLGIVFVLITVRIHFETSDTIIPSQGPSAEGSSWRSTGDHISVDRRRSGTCDYDVGVEAASPTLHVEVTKTEVVVHDSK